MLLQVEGLNTYYGESHVLQNMSISVGDGETVALLGQRRGCAADALVKRGRDQH